MPAPELLEHRAYAVGIVVVCEVAGTAKRDQLGTRDPLRECARQLCRHESVIFATRASGASSG